MLLKRQLVGGLVDRDADREQEAGLSGGELEKAIVETLLMLLTDEAHLLNRHPH